MKSKKGTSLDKVYFSRSFNCVVLNGSINILMKTMSLVSLNHNSRSYFYLNNQTRVALSDEARSHFDEGGSNP